MSLFHTTKKTLVVGTSVAPLFDKENIISSTKIGANEYFLFENKSTSVDINKKGLTDFLIQAVSGNIVNKYNKFKKSFKSIDKRKRNTSYLLYKIEKNKLMKEEELSNSIGIIK